ncbi:ABC transporter permease [Rhodohalobacter sp. 614A]|uniref:ABC transporter permease n=1 Tax=Rhodohalobacter sp. 614A TaxID=2908649 RepID=UPI001F3073BD|nr:ABC transporter permease [Rhodohalobacter sp. 614A]
MLINYIKIAWRNLIRDRTYSFINIAGLTIGLSACLLLVLFARYELSFDTFHEKSDRIYRMTSVAETENEVIERAYTPVPLVQALKDELPEVEMATHLSRTNSARIEIEDQTVTIEDFYWTDQNFFDIFSVSVIEGNEPEFLSNPNSIVITQSVSETYFNSANPLGKTIQLSNDTYRVTGVVDDWPANSHFRPQFIATFNTLGSSEDDSWFSFNNRTYFLLEEKASIKSLMQKLPSILESKFGEQAQELGIEFTYTPQALTDIHLYSNLEGELEQNGSIRTIQIILAIAFLILLNACVNYINLSTARARKRAKEVGIRKALGSGRAHLIFQFLGEAFALTGISFLLSLMIIETILPGFNTLFNQELNSSMLFEPVSMSIFVSLMVLTALLAGIYPAFYLTSFSAKKVLKGDAGVNTKNSFSWGRRSMVVFQFLICITLMVSSLVILKQMRFIQQKDLGFEESNLIVIPLGTGEERNGFQALKDKLLANSNILGITSAPMYPGGEYANAQHWLPGETVGEYAEMGFVGPDFVDVFGMNIKEGRDFTENDQQSVIINETAVQRFGLGENPIGKQITRTDPRADERPMYEVVGVIEDFNTASLRETIQPLVMYQIGFNVNMIVRFAEGQTQSALSFIRDAFNEVNPNSTFEYHFVDDYLSEYYRADENFLRIVTSFTLLAVFIAGMGLLGLVGYFIQSRTKELAIRKVLGASVSNIMALLSKDFVLLVIIGFVIAIPVGWYAMNQWLTDFAYRIDIGADIFVLAGGAALLIAILTVSWQSIRAAFENPVDSLRSE